jgi:hypothetical protein
MKTAAFFIPEKTSITTSLARFVALAPSLESAEN